MSLYSFPRTVLAGQLLGMSRIAPGVGGLGSKAGSRLSAHISLYTGNRTYFAITWAAEACWCFFPVRVLKQMTNLEMRVAEIGWESIGRPTKDGRPQIKLYS